MPKTISIRIFMACILFFIGIPLGFTAEKPNLQSPLKSSSQIINSADELDRFVIDQMKTNKVLGLSLAVIADNTIVYHKGFGIKDSASKIPVNENSIFQAASLTKPVTAYAALKLVSEGKLALDEPLKNYVKEPYIPEERYAEKITLRMILTHTSGMNNDSSGRDRSISSTPGKYFNYSGAGFRYLQQAIEDVTGQPFDRYIDETILTPLEMSDSLMSYNEELSDLFADGPSPSYRVNQVNAAYSLQSTPTDLAKFLLEMMNPTLVDPQLARLMTSPCRNINENYAWGLGIGIQHSPIGDSIWQWGNNENIFHAFLFCYKDQKTGVIIMTNNPNGQKVLKKIAHKAIGGYYYSFLDVIP